MKFSTKGRYGLRAKLRVGLTGTLDSKRKEEQKYENRKSVWRMRAMSGS